MEDVIDEIGGAVANVCQQNDSTTVPEDPCFTQ